MKKHVSTPSRRTSLDSLRDENLLLQGLIRRIDENRGSSVEARYNYGNAAKQIIRHVAIRQSSLMDVATAITEVPGLRSTARRMIDKGTDRRVLIDEVGGLSRNIQGLYLNQGQDFDGPLTALIHEMSPEMEWELADAIPLIRLTLSPKDAASRFSTARYVERHAPTSLNTSGPRWYEHAPVISRLVTFYDFLRDHPRASRHERITASP